ncbi:MAG: guanylate kinase [Bacteroidales bacterium]
MEGKLVIISAPSGAGKTTIVNHLLEKGLNLEFSVSATTRKPRGTEINGKEYYFISADEFRSRIGRNEFVEWEEVYRDQFYGTLKSEVEKIWSHDNHVLFDVDPKGGIHLKDIFGTRAISIFVMPPSVEELEKRLVIRGTENSEKIKIRVAKAVEEMNLASHFDHVIINDILERAANEAREIVRSFLDKNTGD